MMMSSGEINKLKSAYYALLVFWVIKGCLVVPPDTVKAAINTYFTPADDNNASNITDGKSVKCGPTNAWKWLDSGLFLECLVWEFFPYLFMNKIPIKAMDILLWTMAHQAYSISYIIFKILETWDLFCVICCVKIFLQLISAIMALSILIWTREIIKNRMYLIYT